MQTQLYSTLADFIRYQICPDKFLTQYALCPSLSRTSARLIYYHRCLGFGPAKKSMWHQNPLRQIPFDQLDWDRFLGLVEDATLFLNELNHRLKVIRVSCPTQL